MGGLEGSWTRHLSLWTVVINNDLRIKIVGEGGKTRSEDKVLGSGFKVLWIRSRGGR